MNIQQTHYEFKLKADKIDSLAKRNLKPWEIDWILNEAIKIFVKQRLGQTNIKKEGFETSQKRIDDLRTLQVKSPTTSQPGVAPVQVTVDNAYEFKFSDFAFPYWFLTNLTLKATKGDCDKIIRDVKQIQHDDLSNYLEYDFYKPSFNWNRALAVEGKTDTTDRNEGSIYVYTNGDFVINEIYPEYIKKPKEVWIGTYNSLGGTYVIGNPSVDIELPEHTHNEIVDIAVLESSRILENPNFYQLKEAKLTINE